MIATTNSTVCVDGVSRAKKNELGDGRQSLSDNSLRKSAGLLTVSKPGTFWVLAPPRLEILWNVVNFAVMYYHRGIVVSWFLVKWNFDGFKLMG